VFFNLEKNLAMNYKISTIEQRVLSHLIDYLIYLPSILFSHLCLYLGYYYQLLGHSVALVFTIWYMIFYVFQNEKTIGKAKQNIKIISKNGERINLKQVAIRYFSLYFLSIIPTIIIMFLILSTPEGNYSELGFLDKMKYVVTQNGFALIILSQVSSLYLFANFIMVCIQEEHRGIHDYIAGTIVVQDES
jgi:uncharacterized RDD family membrane protein YckC